MVVIIIINPTQVVMHAYQVRYMNGNGRLPYVQVIIIRIPRDDVSFDQMHFVFSAYISGGNYIL